MSYPWNEEDIEALKRLVAEGLSSGQIANRIGKPRNAIIGKIHRLGLTLSRSTGRTGPRLPPGYQAGQLIPLPLVKPPPARPRAAALQAPAAPSRVYTPPPPRETPPSRPRRDPPGGAAPYRTCQWYFGDPRAGDFRQCPDPTYGGSSYCDHHHHIVYVPAPPKKTNPRTFQ